MKSWFLWVGLVPALLQPMVVNAQVIEREVDIDFASYRFDLASGYEVDDQYDLEDLLESYNRSTDLLFEKSDLDKLSFDLDSLSLLTPEFDSLQNNAVGKGSQPVADKLFASLDVVLAMMGKSLLVSILLFLKKIRSLTFKDFSFVSLMGLRVNSRMGF